MNRSWKMVKLSLLVLSGLAALAVTKPEPLRASGGLYCTSDCDRAIAYLGCKVGTTCTARTCTGESGTLYPYELSCQNEM